MKTLTAILFVVLVSTLALAGQPARDQVRTPSGKLIGTTTTRGNVTEGRNATGKLEYKSTVKPNGTTEVRDATGKLLYKINK